MGYIISLFIGYLLGSINGSILVSKSFGKDIRNYGSGNAGATNTLRVFGKKAVVLVLLVDLLKGILAVLIARLIFDNNICTYLAGAAAIYGHIFPVFFGFRGGKGVLTALGVLMCLDYKAALVLAIGALLIMAFTKYVSLGSCIAAILLIVYSFVFYQNIPFCVFSILCGGIVLIKHSSNIKRLIKGTERKLGEKSE